MKDGAPVKRKWRPRSFVSNRAWKVFKKKKRESREKSAWWAPTVSRAQVKRRRRRRREEQKRKEGKAEVVCKFEWTAAERFEVSEATSHECKSNLMWNRMQKTRTRTNERILMRFEIVGRIKMKGHERFSSSLFVLPECLFHQETRSGMAKGMAVARRWGNEASSAITSIEAVRFESDSKVRQPKVLRHTPFRRWLSFDKTVTVGQIGSLVCVVRSALKLSYESELSSVQLFKQSRRKDQSKMKMKKKFDEPKFNLMKPKTVLQRFLWIVFRFLNQFLVIETLTFIFTMPNTKIWEKWSKNLKKKKEKKIKNFISFLSKWIVKVFFWTDQMSTINLKATKQIFDFNFKLKLFKLFFPRVNENAPFQPLQINQNILWNNYEERSYLFDPILSRELLKLRFLCLSWLMPPMWAEPLKCSELVNLCACCNPTNDKKAK